MEKILINSLLEQNGFRMFITAKNGKRDYALSNANQFVVSDEDTAHLKKVCSFVMEQKNKKQTSAEQYGITKERNLQMYDLLFRKLRDTVYKEKLSAQVASLEKGRPVFEGLELKEQCLVLTEILCFFSSY